MKGEKLVCVYNFILYPGPKKGEIVTVENSFIETGGDGNTYTFLELLGYNTNMSDGRRVNYNLIRFRPIDYSFGEEVIEKLEKESIQITVEV
jgi:hypothetical protein